MNVDLAYSSTGVIYILSSYQGVHVTRCCSWSTEALLEDSSVGQNLLSGFKAPALIFKLASGTLPARLGSEELLLQGVHGDAPWTNSADGDQGTSCLDDTSHQQPFQVNPSFTHLGTLGGERPRTSLLWRRVRVRRGADGLALGSLQSLLLQELPVSLSLAVFPLTSPLLDEPCQHAVGAPAWEQSSRAERLVWPWWVLGAVGEVSKGQRCENLASARLRP